MACLINFKIGFRNQLNTWVVVNISIIDYCPHTVCIKYLLGLSLPSGNA